MPDEPAVVQMTVVPTGDEWVAPVVLIRYLDGSYSLCRDLDTDEMGPWTGRTVYPHARLYVNGLLSPFDARADDAQAVTRGD